MRAIFIAALLPIVLSSAVYAEPRIDYLLYCRGCHLANGAGVPPEVPTLIDEIGRIVALPGGREYVVRVPGVAQSDLNDAKLAAVLNWVLAEFNADTTPMAFEPYTADYVGKARTNTLKDPLRARAELLSSD